MHATDCCCDPAVETQPEIQPRATAAPALALDDAQRQRCEVWTRVMGYHRPVSSFNVGKRGEHHERTFFVERPRADA